MALGRAIVREPQAFLMDEPLSNLDAKLRTQTRVELKRLHHRLGATVLYVTHDQTEAMTLGDRIVVMKDGVVQQVDTPDGIYHRPANTFVATFVGTPPMNLMEVGLERQSGRLVGRIDNQVVDLPASLASIIASESDRRVMLGIRPEDMVLAIDDQLPADHLPLEAIVRLVEPMGHEIIVYLEAGSVPLIVRTSNEWSGVSGDNVRVGLDARRLSAFDPQTEAAIGR